MSNERWELFATAPRGLEPLLAEELRTLGATDVREARAGASFVGDQSLAYRACLWLRTAGRILLKLKSVPAPTPDALYAGVREMEWETHLTSEGTLAVDCALVQSAMTHTQFAALKVKDAIVDRFRANFGARPSVRVQHPDVRVNVYIVRDRATVSLDLSGESLHRRGYRDEGGAAPLKENLASALLMRARWPRIAPEGGALMDPMCGSGTLLIEGALMAADIAPGLYRSHFGFENGLQHDARLWRDLIEEARDRRKTGLKTLPVITGSDRDEKAVALARENIRRAGLESHIAVEQRDATDARPPEGPPGLFIANPPYGERMAEVAGVQALYESIGDILRAHFPGWWAAIFTGRPELGQALRLKPRRTYDLYNGALPCRLLLYKLGLERREVQPIST